jgi:hypothetical protein
MFREHPLPPSIGLAALFLFEPVASTTVETDDGLPRVLDGSGSGNNLQLRSASPQCVCIYAF